MKKKKRKKTEKKNPRTPGVGSLYSYVCLYTHTHCSKRSTRVNTCRVPADHPTTTTTTDGRTKQLRGGAVVFACPSRPHAVVLVLALVRYRRGRFFCFFFFISRRLDSHIYRSRTRVRVGERSQTRESRALQINKIKYYQYILFDRLT